MKKTPPKSTPSSAPDSRITILQLLGDYAGRLMIIATACIMVLLTVVVWLVQGFYDKHFVTARHVALVAGLGFTTIVAYYFKPVRKPR